MSIHTDFMFTTILIFGGATRNSTLFILLFWMNASSSHDCSHLSVTVTALRRKPKTETLFCTAARDLLQITIFIILLCSLYSGTLRTAVGPCKVWHFNIISHVNFITETFFSTLQCSTTSLNYTTRPLDLGLLSH